MALDALEFVPQFRCAGKYFCFRLDARCVKRLEFAILQVRPSMIGWKNYAI